MRSGVRDAAVALAVEEHPGSSSWDIRGFLDMEGSWDAGNLGSLCDTLEGLEVNGILESEGVVHGMSGFETREYIDDLRESRRYWVRGTKVLDVDGCLRSNPGLTLRGVLDAGCSYLEFRRLRSIGRIVDIGGWDAGRWISRYHPYGARGRDICCMEALVDLEENPELVRVIDTETTGLSPDEDRLLQLSILDGNGEVLFDSYIHPYGVSSWPKAQSINGISPAMVRDSPSMSELRPRVEDVLKDAVLIIGYNPYFDISFLKAAGVEIPRADVCDVMEDYAPIAGEWAERANGGQGGWKWQKLVNCAGHYGYRFHAHDSLEDTKATLHCCRCVGWDQVDNRTYVQMRNIRRCSTTWRWSRRRWCVRRRVPGPASTSSRRRSSSWWTTWR